MEYILDFSKNKWLVKRGSWYKRIYFLWCLPTCILHKIEVKVDEKYREWIYG